MRGLPMRTPLTHTATAASTKHQAAAAAMTLTTTTMTTTTTTTTTRRIATATAAAMSTASFKKVVVEVDLQNERGKPYTIRFDNGEVSLTDGYIPCIANAP